MSFKNVALSSGSHHKEGVNLPDEGSEPNVSVNPDVTPANASLADCVPNPLTGAAFPEAVVIDELYEVLRDVKELSKSCLIGKMLGEPLDVL